MFGITERRDFSYKIQRKTNAESYKIQFSSSHLSVVYTYRLLSLYIYIYFIDRAADGWVFTVDSFLHKT